jgi:hypothetical protein
VIIKTEIPIRHVPYLFFSSHKFPSVDIHQLCGVNYTARTKGADNIFGVYAHEKCRNKQLVKLSKIPSLLNKFIPRVPRAISAKPASDQSSAGIRISRDDIQSFGSKTKQMQGYIRGAYVRDFFHPLGGFDRHYFFDALWMMPHWCTRHTLYDAIVAKKTLDPDDEKTAAIYNALLKHRKSIASEAERKKTAAAKKEANVEQRLSDFCAHVGQETCGGIIQLVTELETTKKALKKKHGKVSSGKFLICAKHSL